MSRLGLAWRCFCRVLSGKPLPPEIFPEAAAPAALPPATDPAKEKFGAMIQMMTLLQKEGRLLDFLEEEIESYDDAQIGAAVRNIHRGCQKVLREHLGTAPVIVGTEGSSVTIEPGFDPSRIRLLGNVTGHPPFRGELKHHGWRAASINVPSLPAGHDGLIIAPAEVEIP